MDLGRSQNRQNTRIYSAWRGGWGPNPIRSSASPPPADVKSSSHRRAIGTRASRSSHPSSRRRVWCRGAAPTGAGAARFATAEAEPSAAARARAMGLGASTRRWRRTRSAPTRRESGGSYRYHNYGVAAPPSYAKRESERYCRSSPSAASSSSSSRGQGGGVAAGRGGAGQALHRPRQRQRVTRPPTHRRHGTGLQ
jgi:hypothetical protein